MRKKAFNKLMLILSMCVLSSSSAMGQTPLGNMEQAIRGAVPGLLIFTQGLPPLRPKPGYVRGRVMDMQGRPLTNIEITIVGTLYGGAVNVAQAFEPNIDSRTGYYEIPVPDGIYRVHATFNKFERDQLPPTLECLLLVDASAFVSADGQSAMSRSDSRTGIVKDFIWKPSPQDIVKCMR
jgi:hypothetical protein